MKLRFQLRKRNGGFLPSMLVNVPRKHLLLSHRRGYLWPYDISQAFLGAFEAKHNAFVISIGLPARSGRPYRGCRA